jgi:hypothetical protein
MFLPGMNAVWVGLMIFWAIPVMRLAPTLVKKIEAHVEEANRSILFYTACIFFFGKEGNDAKV